MPLSLLLGNVPTTLAAAATVLVPWTEIVALEATIVERARSAFLVHWFGKRLPFQGLSLRAVIVNVEQLDAQFMAAQRSVQRSPGGPNLTQPVLGFAGAAAGVLLSPLGAIAGTVALVRHARLSVTVVLAAIAWVVVPFLLLFGLVAAPAGTLILTGGALAGAGIGFAVAAQLGDDRTVRALFDLFGSLARFMNATVAFLGQLRGPREEVRNPLLRRLLDLAPRVSALLAQVIGAVAVIVRRIGPVMEPVAETLLGIGALARSVFAALEEVVAGLLTRLDELAAGPLSITPIVRRAADLAQEHLARIQRTLVLELDVLLRTLRDLGSTIRTELDAFASRVGTFVRRLFTAHPVVRVLEAFATQIGIIRTSWATIPALASTRPSFFAPLRATLPSLPSLRDFPELPSVPASEPLRRRLGAAAVPELDLTSIEAAAARLGAARTDRIELSAQARAAIARAGRRPSILAPERRALEAELGRSPAAALELNRQQLDQFREAFSVVVGRVLPPELRARYVPQLAEVLTAIDRRLYGRESGSPAELPVLDVPTTDRLQPVVRMMRLRVPGAAPPDVRQFADLLTERLRGQSYRADTPVPVPAGGAR